MKKKTIKTREDAAIFVDALINTPEPNEALKMAAKRYKGISINREYLINHITRNGNTLFFSCEGINCIDCVFSKDTGCSSADNDYEYQPLIDFLKSSKKVNITLKDIKPFKI